MSERAFKNRETDDAVVRLDDDERWQQRLAEARARRAIALQEKANGDSKPLTRPKPWEEEPSKVPTIVEAPRERDENGDIRRDFADRVEAIRAKGQEPAAEQNNADTKNLARPKSPVPAPLAEPAITKTGVPVDLDRSDFAMPADVQAPDREALAYGASLDALPELLEQCELPVASEAAAGKAVRGRPRGLALGLFALALLPFVNVLPPKEVGPAMPPAPLFAMEPAFGLTAPNFAPPVATASGEWTPDSIAAPTSPLTLLAPEPPVLWEGLEGLPAAPEADMLELILPVTLAGLESQNSSQIIALSEDVKPSSPVPPNQIRVQATVPMLKSYDFLSFPGSRSAFNDLTVLSGAPLALPFETQGGDTVVADVSAGRVPETLDVAAQPAAASVDPLRVTVLVPEKAEQDIALGVAQTITKLGHDIADVKTVNLTISQRNVRYFHPGDRAEAEQLAVLNNASLRDFTSFRPSPAEGVVEVWLSGKAADVPVQVARTTRAIPVTRARTVEQPQQPRGLLGWIADRLGGNGGERVARRGAVDHGSDRRGATHERSDTSATERSGAATAQTQQTAQSAASVSSTTSTGGSATSGDTSGSAGHSSGSDDSSSRDDDHDDYSRSDDDDDDDRDSYSRDDDDDDDDDDDRSGSRSEKGSKKDKKDKKERRDKDDD